MQGAALPSPVLPLATSLQLWPPKGRISSLTHSEYQPSNTDEAEPLCKQLLSDSVRPTQVPGVTEFSHLPKEINKRAVLPREDVPPASSTAQSGHSGTTPGEDVPGSGTKDFLKPSGAWAAQQAVPRGPPHARGQSGAQASATAQSWVQTTLHLPGGHLPSLHPSLHTWKRQRRLPHRTLSTEMDNTV